MKRTMMHGLLVCSMLVAACGTNATPDAPTPAEDTSNARGIEDSAVSKEDVAAPVVDAPSPSVDTPLTDAFAPPETTQDIASDIASEDIEEPADVEQDAGPPPEPVTVSLIDMFEFMLAPTGMDPWYGDGTKADEELCEPSDHGPETTEDGDWYDVDTSFCGYLTVSQPLLDDVPAGAELVVDIFHNNITEGFEGQYLLGMGMGAAPADIVWSLEIDIPVSQGFITKTWTAQNAYAKGDALYFHISNHGENNWSLLGLTATFVPAPGG